MISIKKLVIYIIFLALPTWGLSANLKHIYSDGKKIFGFEETTAETSTYSLHQTTKISKSSMSKNTEMSISFPDHVLVEISFINIQPNKIVFFDNKCIPIDKKGSFEIDFPVMPGIHKISELRSSIKVTIASLNIQSDTFIECIGGKKTQCKITHLMARADSKYNKLTDK